ncbi:PREDICTED: uncharacterized protein LOC108547342 [Eufriesea mexicana]|uniref:uncharacterized protein LOC108547342 n=1 Tax=Eufriesea mexicana TaxID=516756 RepID=UPI00083C12B4|nr:PREDICTED: uncharacterized protein LOC108547342 [Eufriesea mexicana]XP_017755305.1 PREDICTED: uncharacterized protein LOC108547342 [Eufriesea mexicana]
MGNQLVRNTWDTHCVILPAERFSAPYNHWQYNERCRDFELEAAECVCAYGFLIGQTKCKDILDDLLECASGEKLMNRQEILVSEFARKVKAGERTFEEIPFIYTFD